MSSTAHVLGAASECDIEGTSIGRASASTVCRAAGPMRTPWSTPRAASGGSVLGL